MADYIVHKAVELGKVRKEHRPTEDELRTAYLAYPKYDGCAGVLIKHNPSPETVEFYSRTGEEVVSANHIKEAIAAASFLPQGVYFGEYWHPTIDQPTVSGMFRKKDGTQYTEPFFVVFDFVTLEEWEAGKTSVGYHDRVSRLPPLAFRIEECKAPVFFAESQGFLCDQGLGSQEAARLLADSGAYDGIILRKPSGKWRKGDKGTHGEIIKIKPTLTLDLQVTNIGKSKGAKTGRDVYTVFVALPNGNEQEVGSGVPHSADELPGIGQIVEIEAMSYSKKGLLREPRYKGIRYDKTEPDR